MFRLTGLSLFLLLVVAVFFSSHDSTTLFISIADAQDCGYKSDGKYHCGTNCGYKSDGKYHCGTNCGYKSDGNYHCIGEDAKQPPKAHQPVKPPDQDCGYKSDGEYHCGTNCGYKSDGKYHCGTNCGYKSDGKFHCKGED